MTWLGVFRAVVLVAATFGFAVNVWVLILIHRHRALLLWPWVWGWFAAATAYGNGISMARRFDDLNELRDVYGFDLWVWLYPVLSVVAGIVAVRSLGAAAGRREADRD